MHTKKTSRFFSLSEQEDELFSCLRPPPPYPGGSDSETPSPARRRGSDKQSALSAIQPLLAAHGLGESTIAAVAASVTGGSGGKSKRIKLEKDRDSNAPKKPANAFLMFCQQRRCTIQEEHLKVFAGPRGTISRLPGSFYHNDKSSSRGGEISVISTSPLG